MREELAETVAMRERAQREKQHVTVLLQAALLAAQNGGAMDKDVNGKEDPEGDIPVSVDPSEDVVIYNGASTNGDILKRQPSDGLVEQQCVLRLLHENKKLRAELLELESEMVREILESIKYKRKRLFHNLLVIMYIRWYFETQHIEGLMNLFVDRSPA